MVNCTCNTVRVGKQESPAKLHTVNTQRAKSVDDFMITVDGKAVGVSYGFQMSFRVIESGLVLKEYVERKRHRPEFKDLWTLGRVYEPARVQQAWGEYEALYLKCVKAMLASPASALYNQYPRLRESRDWFHQQEIA